MTSRRAGGAVFASAALHVLAVWWLTHAQTSMPTRPLPSPVPVVQLTWIDAVPAPTPPAPAQAPVKQQTPGKRGAAQTSTPAAPEPSEPAQPAGSAPATTELPRIVGLLPRDSVLGLPVPAAPTTGGRTLRPSDLPDPNVKAQEDARAAQVAIQRWATADVGDARAARGIASPEATALRSAMFNALKGGHELDVSSAEKLKDAIVAGWLPAASRYGRTGTGYDTAAGWRRDFEMPNTVSAQASAGSERAKQLQMFYEAGARFRDFGAGRSGLELVTVVRISGANIELLTGSGLGEFDTWVLSQADATLASRADAGMPNTPSIWAFRGRITYMRSVKDINFKKDWPMLTALMATGLFTGTFDEQTGQMEYVDLSHPKFEATPHLVREE